MVCTRFPPSPTGFLHVGSLRTALYNYLFARKHKGRFIFRLEDTDRARTVAGAAENLIETLKWAGLNYDEGPYVQSERLDLYKKYAHELLEKYAAYPCFCTTERLEEMRREQEAHKLPPKYDGLCRRISSEEMKANLAKKIPYVVRQKIPESGKTEWRDLVRGDVSFNHEILDDQILLKSDGYPTYHLANVVDDHSMEVTHVIRGEEWLSSTPKHILLYEAFGWKAPEFAHLPLLLNKDRSKLSKRQGDVAVEEYRTKGYLPEALINFVALLGWHPGGETVPKGTASQEIFSLEELVEKFSLEKVHKGGAVFDVEKLNWMNWQWRRRKYEEALRQAQGDRGEELLKLCGEFLPDEWKNDPVFLKRCLRTVEEKILQQPSETPQYLEFYFKKSLNIPTELIANPKMKVDLETAKRALAAVIEALEDFDKFDDQEALKTRLTSVIEKLGLKTGQVLWPTRVALTGEQFSPGVFEVLWALGKEQSLKRLQRIIGNL